MFNLLIISYLYFIYYNMTYNYFNLGKKNKKVIYNAYFLL